MRTRGTRLCGRPGEMPRRSRPCPPLGLGPQPVGRRGIKVCCPTYVCYGSQRAALLVSSGMPTRSRGHRRETVGSQSSPQRDQLTCLQFPPRRPLSFANTCGFWKSCSRSEAPSDTVGKETQNIYVLERTEGKRESLFCLTGYLNLFIGRCDEWLLFPGHRAGRTVWSPPRSKGRGTWVLSPSPGGESER